jgi:predicted amino acid-binding ACT domain protein
MALKVTKTDIWAAKIKDQPGELAKIMAKIAAAGANLKCVIARRQPDKPGTGLIFVTPLKGRKVRKAAAAAGFRTSKSIATLVVEGNDRRGIGARIARAVGAAGVNMRGVSATAMGGKFVTYLGFDSRKEAAKAAKAIKALG